MFGEPPVISPARRNATVVAEPYGLTRQSTNQLLKQLEERGLLTVSRGKIVVLAQDGLLEVVRTG